MDKRELRARSKNALEIFGEPKTGSAWLNESIPDKSPPRTDYRNIRQIVEEIEFSLNIIKIRSNPLLRGTLRISKFSISKIPADGNERHKFSVVRG